MPTAPSPESETAPDHAPSKRIAQLNSLVQQEVSGILARELEFAPGTFVTVTRASVADDAESAKVWISVLPEGEADNALKLIQRRIKDVQKRLNRTLVMKFVPKLTFHVDMSNAKAAHIIEVLDSLPKKDLETPQQ